MAKNIDFNKCVLCQSSSEETVQSVTKEAVPKLFQACCEKGDSYSMALRYYDDKRELFLSLNPVYHAKCRRNYTRKAYKKRSEAEEGASKCLSKRLKFSYSNICIICNKDRDSRGLRKLKQILTFNKQNEIWNMAKTIDDHKLLHRIQGFGNNCIDMIAHECAYHNLCFLKLLRKSKSEVNCPQESEGLSFETIFNKIESYLENALFIENMVFTISEVRHMLHKEAKLWNIEWTAQYPSSEEIINKLQNFYKEKIMVVSRDGKLSSYICSTRVIIRELDAVRNSSSSDSDADVTFSNEGNSPYKLQSNAYNFAKYLRADLIASCNQQDTLTITKECASYIIPKSLHNLFSWILTEKEVNFDRDGKVLLEEKLGEKVLNICQDFLFALTGLKTPKHVGLAVYILKHTRSKKIVNIISNFGNSVSYTDAQRYINDMAVQVDEKIALDGIFIPTNLQANAFTQFAFDNLDFSGQSIEGNTIHGTTHIVYQFIGNTYKNSTLNNLPRKHTINKIQEVTKKIEFSETLLTKRDKDQSRSLRNTNIQLGLPTEQNQKLSLIWNLINIEEDGVSLTPLNWSTFHEIIASNTNKPTKTEIGYGPFVPSSPTKVEVVENSIEYCLKVAQRLNQKHVIITVDEAIYEIVYGLRTKFPEKYKNVIPRMGGFHICLNFLGAIGRIMSNSGIEDLLVGANILLPGTANKIISGGKDYYKMIRAHNLVHSAVFELYWEQFLDWLLDANVTNPHVSYVSNLVDEIKHLKLYLVNDDDSDMIAQSYANICNLMNEIEPLLQLFNQTYGNSPTALFWLQYIDMVCILQWYIIAERNGDWNQHLSCVEKMLPYMISAGHYKYVSYIPHYLQDMRDLKKTAPEVHTAFIEGKFNIHVRNGVFNGVWTDMALEQTYNKNAKNKLFHGISMQEITVQKYLNSLPLMSTISDELENMFQSKRNISINEVHHDSSCDALKTHTNILEIKRIIKQKVNPFEPDLKELVNIYSGCISKSSNVYKAEEIGMAAIVKANKENAEKIGTVKLELFDGKEKAKTKKTVVSALYESEAKILRHLHFTRELDEEAKIRVFSHEWTPYPSSLFEIDSENNIIMRKGNKSEFYKAVLREIKDVPVELCCMPIEESDSFNTAYIIDMMALIQRYQNFNSRKFGELFLKYVSLILKLKPRNCDLIICIGDRYDFENSLKQTERYRRSKNCHLETYEIRDELDIPDWKKFISNPFNKKNLLAYLAQNLMKENYVIPDQIEIVLAGMSEDNHKTIKCTKMESKVVDELKFNGHEEADTRIFATINFYKDKFNVFLIYSLDTDVFVLSMFFSVILDVKIWMEREKKFIPCFSIIKALANLKHLDVKILADNLLSLYCLSGCDSVSFPFRKGKKRVVKIVLSQESDEMNILSFGTKSNTCDSYEISDELLSSCRLFFKHLYGRKDFRGNMDELRAHMFPTCKTDIRDLPPTEDSFIFHVRRAFLQCAIFKTAYMLKPDLPEILKFGYERRENNCIVPTLMSKAAKPTFFKITPFCKCKLFNCDHKCKCLKANVKCNISCQCEGKCVSK